MEITYQHSLYSHQLQLIDEFNEIMLRYFDKLPAYEGLPHNEEDHIAAIFNYWITFVETNTHIPPKINRLMTHRCNFLLIEIIENCTEFQQYLQEIQFDKEKIFVLSYFIASEYLLWIAALLHENGQGQFTHVNRQRHYFTLTSDDQLDEQDSLFYEQKLVTYFLIQDTQASNRYLRYARKAVHLTETFLENNKLGVNDEVNH